MNTARKAKNFSWKFLRTFKKRSPELSWHCFDALKKAAPLGSSFQEYKRLLQKWKHRLHQFGGDPSELGWINFRPLRLSREEDWSDWFAWLFSNSTSGELALSLFGGQINRSAQFFRTPKIIREDLTEDQKRRGDILLLWPPHIGIHLEVKIGDEQFEKTLETGQKLQAKHGHIVREWKNFILIPNESLNAWIESLGPDENTESEVHFVLWDEVAKALRKCLWLKVEDTVWRTWAWTFCGAIESKLLGLEKQSGKRIKFGQFASLVRWIELLEVKKG